jgi:hypothetical protein
MIDITHKMRICALLLALIFLTAQFHLCADLNAGSNAAHFCPYCLNSVSDVVPGSTDVGVVLTMVRLEVSLKSVVVSAGVPLVISPRAPPAV